jgi:phosphoserine phosphatase
VRTSPLERCVVMGARIAEACGLQSLSTQGLLDLHYGEWQWKTYDEINERWPDLYALWRSAPHLVRFPFGESLQDIVRRSADVFRSMIEEFPSDTVVLVGHDSVNRALLLQVPDQPLSAYWKIVQDPCCINVIEYDKGTAHVVAINDTRHVKWSAAPAAPRKLLKKRSTSRA